ncbi:MAG: hypothetical protein KME50_03370 [Nostoc desertorum CM1-VF14]|jgi:hypothetical protein|nr:hypothetical protein [Nostoc desertorum CM1-VF14]
MNSNAKEYVVGQRNVNTFMYLKQASRVLLNQAKANQEGSFYNYMTSMLTSAFYLEAYLNHSGFKFYGIRENNSYWKYFEKLNPNKKLEKWSEMICFKIDYGRRPFQTFKEIFKFRNKLVHGKSEIINVNQIQKASEEHTYTQLPKLNWEKMVNMQTAERFLNDAIEMVEMLNKQAGFSSTELYTLASTSTVSQLSSTEQI